MLIYYNIYIHNHVNIQCRTVEVKSGYGYSHVARDWNQAILADNDINNDDQTITWRDLQQYNDNKMLHPHDTIDIPYPDFDYWTYQANKSSTLSTPIIKGTKTKKKRDLERKNTRSQAKPHTEGYTTSKNTKNKTVDNNNDIFIPVMNTKHLSNREPTKIGIIFGHDNEQYNNKQSYDGGAHYYNTSEADLVRDFKNNLEQADDDSEAIEFVYADNGNYEQRINELKAKGVNTVIELHVNANDISKGQMAGRGLEYLYWKGNQDKSNAKLAKTIQQSGELHKAFNTKFRRYYNKGTRSHMYATRQGMKHVLIETGFMNNFTEFNKLNNDTNQQQFANRLVKGLESATLLHEL